MEYDIEVNNCGYYKDVDRDVPTVRPQGRSDHHFLLVERGSMTVEIHGKTRVLTDGDMAYLPPLAPHRYCYRTAEQSRYCWLHVCGTKADAVIAELGFSEEIYHTDRIREWTAALDQILKVLRRAEWGFLPEANSLTQGLLVKMARDIRQSDAPVSRIAGIARAIRSEPENCAGNAALAAKCHLSEYHFIRTFKAEIGHTPQEYRNLALIDKARQLLGDTELSISEVAYLLNIGDPLYFSRFFKKHIGVSPSQYRQRKR